MLKMVTLGALSPCRTTLKTTKFPMRQLTTKMPDKCNTSCIKIILHGFFSEAIREG